MEGLRSWERWGSVWEQGPRQPATPFVMLVCYYFKASPINLCCVTWNTYCRQLSSDRGCRGFEAGRVRSQGKWASGPGLWKGSRRISALFSRVSWQTKISSAASEFRSDGDSDLEFVLKNKYWDPCTHVLIHQREFRWIFLKKALLVNPYGGSLCQVMVCQGTNERAVCSTGSSTSSQSRCKHTKSISQSNNGLLHFGAPVIILVDFFSSLNHGQKWHLFVH